MQSLRPHILCGSQIAVRSIGVISTGKWRMPANVNYIKKSFAEALQRHGYSAEILPAGASGIHSVHFRKVVNKDFLFFPILSISPEWGEKGHRLSLGALIDLKFEHTLRCRRFSMPFSQTNPLGVISFGTYFHVVALSPALAERMKSSSYYDGFASWQCGTTMAEARAFASEVFPLLLESIKLLEDKFHFPSPLDKLTLDDMYRRRLKANMRDPSRTPPSPDDSDLWCGLSLHCGELTAHMMMSYCRKTGNLDMIPKFEEFIESAPPPGPQIIQFKG